ncbi:MAG TPA: Mth938-like domain-containing protein [Magnetospirillaceae bacterium]|jgi:uncharacterized protein
MDVTPQIPLGKQIIQGYGSSGFRIASTRHEGSVLVFPDRTLAWPVASFDATTAESLTEVATADPKVEILLIGTGAKMLLMPAPLRAHFRALGIMVDAMDTGAACRTYNVLMSEDRRVAAALIAIT